MRGISCRPYGEARLADAARTGKQPDFGQEVAYFYQFPFPAQQGCRGRRQVGLRNGRRCTGSSGTCSSFSSRTALNSPMVFLLSAGVRTSALLFSFKNPASWRGKSVVKCCSNGSEARGGAVGSLRQGGPVPPATSARAGRSLENAQGRDGALHLRVSPRLAQLLVTLLSRPLLRSRRSGGHDELERRLRVAIASGASLCAASSQGWAWEESTLLSTRQ